MNKIFFLPVNVYVEFLDEIQSIRKVAREMNGRSKTLQEHQQLLVHCEDGAGRSGVVVMAEILLATMELNEVTILLDSTAIEFCTLFLIKDYFTSAK